MADFEDTNGWRDELSAWLASDEYKSRTIEDFVVDPNLSMKRDKIIPLANLMLNDPDCHAALQRIVE